MHAYLDDLARLGPFGKNKEAVVRRFIEDGIQRALRDKVIEPRKPSDYEAEEKKKDADED